MYKFVIMVFDSNYWNNKYINNEHRWDIGYASPAITNYFDNINDKSVKILIPGCGSGYEGEYLIKQGFKNVFLLDISIEAKKRFLERCPNFDNFYIEDFFSFKGEFDYIVEQTFFCALDPNLREDYAIKMKSLLNYNGKLIGLIFNDKLNKEQPPFGGSRDEYEGVFSPIFNNVNISICKKSIKERMGREFFIELY